VTLSATFAELEWAAARLDEAFGNLAWAAVQGQPSSKPGPAVVDFWEDSAQDMADQTRKALESARVGRLAANGRLDSYSVRQALSGCQTIFDTIWLHYCTELVDFDRRKALQEVTRRAPEWTGWVTGVVDALGQCPKPLYDLSRTLTQCWEEVADQHGPLSVSVTAKTTGRDIDITDDRVPASRNDVGTAVARDETTPTNVES
jgi:hypothetical protein